MTVYAVFLCTVLANGQQVCQPTAFKSDPTEAACEAHKRGMERIVNPGVKVVCMKRQCQRGKEALVIMQSRHDQ
jgi:hypothetical protein